MQTFFPESCTIWGHKSYFNKLEIPKLIWIKIFWVFTNRTKVKSALHTTHVLSVHGKFNKPWLKSERERNLMDFPFLEWSVLEQTRFESLTFLYFFQTSPPLLFFADKCFWISFFHSNSLCEGLLLHVLALYDVLCKQFIFHWNWGHCFEAIYYPSLDKTFFVTIVSNCDIILTWFIFSATLTSNVHIWSSEKVGQMTTLTSKVFFIPLLLHLCKNAIWFPFLFRKIYLLYRQNHL